MTSHAESTLPRVQDSGVVGGNVFPSFEASGKRLFLLAGLELRQQERVADTDFLTVEGINDALP